MDTIPQMAFSRANLLMKIYEFRLIFYSSLFLRVKFTYIQCAQLPRALSQYKNHLSKVWDCHVKDKTVAILSCFNMWIPILTRHLYIETPPWFTTATLTDKALFPITPINYNSPFNHTFRCISRLHNNIWTYLMPILPGTQHTADLKINHFCWI